ncbi:MAG: HYR domain-containing protein [Verrucomicrobiales bacterium]|nr:HYR domain-containing protein [Verrucomicrobiales bacterium]
MKRRLLIAMLLAGIAVGPSALAATFGFNLVFDSGDLAGRTFAGSIEVTDGDGPKREPEYDTGGFLNFAPIVIDGRVLSGAASPYVLVQGGQPVQFSMYNYNGTDILDITWKAGGDNIVWHQHFEESGGHLEWTQVQCPGGFTLRTQREVDNFTCTEIAGDLVIQDDNDGIDDITNLDGLSGLTAVGGSLAIRGNDSLTNLDGLSTLTAVGGDLSLREDPALSSLEGLSSLTAVGGTLEVSGCDVLTNLDGLSRLSSVGGALYISHNAALSNLDGLSRLSFVGSQVIVDFNEVLANLDGLSGLSSINSSLALEHNAELLDLSGLSGITSVGGYLSIQVNNSLTNLDGLSALTSVGDYVYIAANSTLTRFCGLFNLFDAGGPGGSYAVNRNADNPTIAEILADGPCVAITCPADVVVESGQDTEPEHTGFPTVTPEDATVTHSDVIIPTVCHPAVYSIMRTWSAGAGGNVATCTQTIEVVDTTAPVVDYPPGGDWGCNPTVLPEFDPALVVVTDADPFPTIGFVPPLDEVFGCLTTRTLRFDVDDCSGNRTTVERVYTWTTDTTPPVILCPDDIVVASPEEVPPVDAGAVIATDNCGSAITVVHMGDVNEGTPCAQVVRRTYRATDACGNTSECTQTITVQDNTPPSIACPAGITVGNDAGQCGAAVAFEVTATDNCPETTVTCNPPSGSFFPTGTTTVNCTATDAAGNASACSFDVTVKDDEAPVITCPADLTLGNDPGQCGAVVTFAVIAIDNCSGTTVSCTPASDSFFPTGTTLVNCTATDDAGNFSTCSFSVTVEDTEDPVIVCPADITVDAGSPAGTAVAFEATATDNCPGVAVSCAPASGTVFPIGTTLVECTATDRAGNADSCYIAVTVLSPEQMLAEAIGELDGMDIHRGVKNALLVKLLNARSYLEAGDTAGAIDLLGAFENQVNAQRGKKLSEAQAAILLGHAEAILAALGPAPVAPLSSARGRIGLKGEPVPAGLAVQRRVTGGSHGAGTILQLSWEGPGVLQSAGTLDGPWEDEAHQVSPCWSETDSRERFFRIRTP